MRSDRINCKTIQQVMALALPLTVSQRAHVKSCQQCVIQQQRIQQLDQMVNQAIRDLVPDGFSEQVMSHLPGKIFTYSKSYTPISDKLLAIFSHSPILRRLVIGLGMALGITQLIQFILGIFFVSMMAAM